MQVWLECASCKDVNKEYDEVLGWADEDPISCECGGELTLVGFGARQQYQMVVATVAGARKFFHAVLVKEAKEGGIQ